MADAAARPGHSRRAPVGTFTGPRPEARNPRPLSRRPTLSTTPSADVAPPGPKTFGILHEGWRARLAVAFGTARRVRPLPLRHLRAPPEAAADVQAAIRATAVAVPWDGGGTLLCRSLGRHKIFVSASDVTLAPHLALDGYWAWWITAFLARNLAPGDTFVDCGASYGYMSLLAAELVGPQGRVAAVEPNPALFRLLERTLRLNGMEGRCQAVQAALAAEDAVPAQRHLAAPPESPMSGRLLPADAADAPRMILHPVGRLATLDRLAPEADVVKLHLNGDEPQAWAGMAGLLERRRGLRVLAGLDPARIGHPAATEWLARIAAAGFPLRRVEHDGVARPAEAATILATPGESTLWLSRGEPA